MSKKSKFKNIQRRPAEISPEDWEATPYRIRAFIEEVLALQDQIRQLEAPSIRNQNPSYEQQKSAPTNYSSQSLTWEGQRGRQTILIMDDDLAMQTVLEIALREAGYEVILANDGQEGIEKLKTLNPDLVISDIMMPQMDGVETFQHIKERLEQDGIPLFIITALNRKPWFADLEAEGAVIIQKPFDIDQFLAFVHDMLL